MGFGTLCPVYITVRPMEHKQVETSPETQSRDAAAYVITPVSARDRYVKAVVPIVISIVITAWTWWAQYKNNTLHDKWFILLPLLVAGFWLGAKFYRKTEHKRLAFLSIDIPLIGRVKQAGAIAGGTLGLCALAWISQYSSDQLQEYWWYVWPIGVPGLVWSAIVLLRAHKLVLTPAGEAEAKRLESKRQAKYAEESLRAAEMEDSWYFRYTLAALMLFGAWWIVSEKEKLWWLAIMLVIVAAFQAREFSLLVLAGIVVFLLFQGMAALPVSVAIIIGAVIIARALRR